MENNHFKIGEYVEGTSPSNRHVRGYLVGYQLLDDTNPDSVVAKVAVNNSQESLIIPKTMKEVSQYEKIIKALDEAGLRYENGKIEGKHQPKFMTGDILRHKAYGNNESGNIVITYVYDGGYNYNYQDNCGGGSFGWYWEKDYEIIRRDGDIKLKAVKMI